MYMRFFILIALFLSACVPVNGDVEQAQQTLVAFFDSLNQGQYAEAVELYGGDYEVLTDNNPSLDPSDYVALWKNACTINGAQCLPVRTATLERKVGDVCLFIVEYLSLVHVVAGVRLIFRPSRSSNIACKGQRMENL